MDSNNSSELNEQQFERAFTDGYTTALDAVEGSLLELRAVTSQPRTTVFDDKFIQETITWAKDEWPTLKDAVQERLQHHPQDTMHDIFMRGLTGLVLVRFAKWLENPDVAAIMKDYQHQTETVEFYNEQYATLLHGTDLLKEDQIDLPRLAQGIIAIQQLMVRVDELETQIQRQATTDQLWADAANMMNQYLAELPASAQHPEFDLMVRFRMLVDRYKAEAEQYREMMASGKGR